MVLTPLTFKNNKTGALSYSLYATYLAAVVEAS